MKINFNINNPETFRQVVVVGGAIVLFLIVISAIFISRQAPANKLQPGETNFEAENGILVTRETQNKYVIEVRDVNAADEGYIRKLYGIPDDAEVEIIIPGAAIPRYTKENSYPLDYEDGPHTE